MPLSAVGVDPPHPGPGRERLQVRRVTAVLLAAALLVGAGVWLAVGSEVGRQSPDAVAVSVAERYLAARDGWDAEAARKLLADDATLVGRLVDGPFRGEPRETPLRDIGAAVAFDRVTGSRYPAPDCMLLTRGPPATVRCEHLVQDAWSQALDVGPFDGSSMTFTVAGGRILTVESAFDIGEYNHLVWIVFREWLREAHPAAMEAMYDFSGRNDRVRTSPEAIRLWDRYTTRFTGLVDGTVDVAERFLEARGDWDGRALLSLLAPNANVDDVVTSPDAYVANAAFERATGWRYGHPECRVTDAGPPVRVHCDCTFTTAWSEALDEGPFLGSAFDLDVRDGTIRAVDHTLMLELFRSQVWADVESWLALHAADDLEVMFDGTGPLGADRTDPASIALWETYSDRFLVDVTVEGAF